MELVTCDILIDGHVMVRPEYGIDNLGAPMFGNITIFRLLHLNELYCQLLHYRYWLHES